MTNNNELQGQSASDEEQSLELDRLIHEPGRLRIMAALNSIEKADFKYLETISKLQKSNLSIQTSKLEQAGYITVHKYIKGKHAATRYSITPAGRAAFAEYQRRMNALLQGKHEQIVEPQQESKTRNPTNQGSPNPLPNIP